MNGVKGRVKENVSCGWPLMDTDETLMEGFAGGIWCGGRGGVMGRGEGWKGRAGADAAVEFRPLEIFRRRQCEFWLIWQVKYQN